MTDTLTKHRRLSLGPALIAALVLAALVPALLVSWLLSSNSSRAIETLAENAMGQAAHRVDVGALAHLGESHTVVNALVPPVATSGSEGERTRRWLQDTTSFELMAHALTQQSPNVPYLYFGTEDGSFFGLEREDRGFIVRTIRPGDSGRRHYLISAPGDRSELIRTETTVYDPRARPWYKLAAGTGQRVFTNVYRSAVKNQFDLTLAHPIYDSDQKTLLGVMAVDMTEIRHVAFGELCVARVVGRHETVTVAPDDGSVDLVVIDVDAAAARGELDQMVDEPVGDRQRELRVVRLGVGHQPRGDHAFADDPQARALRHLGEPHGRVGGPGTTHHHECRCNLDEFAESCTDRPR